MFYRLVNDLLTTVTPGDRQAVSCPPNTIFDSKAQGTRLELEHGPSFQLIAPEGCRLPRQARSFSHRPFLPKRINSDHSLVHGRFDSPPTRGAQA